MEAGTPSPNTLRVLLVLEATIGGTRRHLRDLALALRKRGLDVHIAYSARRDPDFARDLALFQSHGIGLSEISMRRAFSPLRDLTAAIRLRQLIRALKPDIVHLHSTKAGLVGRLAALGTGVRVLYTPHCFAFEMDSRLRSLYRLAERLLAPMADGLIAVCESEAEAAREIGWRPERVHVIYNGVEPAAAPPKTRGKGIAFIGRNCRQKGVDTLLAAWQMLKSTVPDASLAVMSDLDDDLRNAFVSAGADVRPFGTPEAAAALLADAAILAMPSRWEAFPYLLLEGLAGGLAVVASDVGGVRDCVRDRENGLLVAPDNPRELAMALQELLVSDSLRQRLSTAAPASVARFTAERMVDHTVALYRDLAVARPL
jgi:glycosyltransferase involved in cell wall biosynthesis